MAPVPAPRRLQSRLDGLSKPGLFRRTPLVQQPVIKKACCDEPKIEEEDGSKVCKNCYTQISETNIVADITFQEDSRGVATVQGGFIGENARHARTLGSAAYRRVGSGEKNSIQEIEAHGRRELAALCPRLSIPDNVAMQASNIWSLAAKQNFTAGRRTDEVIAACLYAACRRQKENTILLMDISEHQRINVFRLGEVYKDLCKDLFLDAETNLGFQRLIEIEPLILKYCRNLEFGDQTRQVAEDAVKIIRRMKRDWITTGRHPAGLCGGAIILAARMNNFRRSVREVVYVAKVADMTIAKRMEEFRRTRSAGMTVDQFRNYGTRLKGEADPPALLQSDILKQRHENKKRKRKEHHARRESSISTTASDASDDSVQLIEAVESQGSQKRAKVLESDRSPPEQRFDADGFAIPALPSPGLGSPTSSKASRKSRKEANRPAPILDISQEELNDEQELEHEIEEVIDDQKMIDTQNDLRREKSDERAKILADQQKAADAQKTQARREALGITWFNDRSASDETLNDNDDLAAEFENDPEVMNCRLSEEEVQMKEKIWVAFNEDWLRTQHEKELLAKINESSGRKDHAKKASRSKRKKRGKMGDGSLLAEAETPIETPADANAAMLAKRAPLAFSRYVNYEALSKVYGGTSRANSEAPTAASNMSSPNSRATTPASSRASPAIEDRTPARSHIRAGRPTPQSSATSRNAQPIAQPSLPATPPATNEQDASTAEKDQAQDGASDEDDDDYADPDDEDYHRDEEYDDNPYDVYDDREDIGEDDDYSRAVDEMGDASLRGTMYEEY